MCDIASLFYIRKQMQKYELQDHIAKKWWCLGWSQNFRTLNHRHITSSDQHGLKIYHDAGKAK